MAQVLEVEATAIPLTSVASAVETLLYAQVDIDTTKRRLRQLACRNERGTQHLRQAKDRHRGELGTQHPLALIRGETGPPRSVGENGTLHVALQGQTIPKSSLR